MTELDSDLDLVKRLLDTTTEKLACLDVAMLPGWALYFLQGIEGLLWQDERDGALILIRDTISDRLERGYWE